MIHDELLAKINAPLGEFDAGDPTRHHLLLAQNKALRAVVELHNPVMNKSDGEYIEGLSSCSACADRYPCSTIQAIEKELK